jgi:hypothetical protein
LWRFQFQSLRKKSVKKYKNKTKLTKDE